jgi:hypothetical protein
MTSSYSPGTLTTWLLVLTVTCYYVCHHVTGSSEAAEERKAHRSTRAKYRVGYMFGKRSSAEGTSSPLFDIVSRYAISRKELESLILRNPKILADVAEILDKNGDGSISASDLM